MTGSPDGVVNDKTEIREYAREARRAIPAEEKRLRAAAAAGRVSTLPELSQTRCVLGYLATTEEIDPAPALHTLAVMGKSIAYPRISAPGALILHRVAGDWDLEPGPHGILQPRGESPVVARGDIDAVLVPGLAFGPGGARLGYGGGYYDRLLPDLAGAVLVGLAFDEQVVGNVPVDDHDVAVDVVVTPTRVLRPGDGL